MKKKVINVLACITILMPSMAMGGNEVGQIGLAGRSYYDSLIEKAEKRCWAIPLSFYISSAENGYDCNGCKTNLAAVIFGKCPITIQDVYLFSKLSAENKVRINNCDALMPERGGIPIGPAGTQNMFGAFASDLYSTLLAPVEIMLDAQRKEFSFVPSFIFHYDFGKKDRYAINGGINIPIKSITHELLIGCKGGKLFNDAFVSNQVQAANTLDQFNRSFIDVSDFILREVLGKKGISYEPKQTKVGVGDISIFMSFEFHVNPLIEIGLALVTPTSGSKNDCNLWEPVLGDNVFAINPYIQFLFSTPLSYINPFIRVAGEFSKSRSNTSVRVPKLVCNPSRTQVQNVPNLDHPSTFNQYYVDAFCAFDSCTPLIAEKACLDQDIGHKVIVGIGNYANCVFSEDFRLGIFYDYVHKGKDRFSISCDSCGGTDSSLDMCITSTAANCTSCDKFDLCSLEKCSDIDAHIISVSLTYKFNNLFELGMGGEFVIRGKNVPSNKSGYFNIALVF